MNALGRTPVWATASGCAQSSSANKSGSVVPGSAGWNTIPIISKGAMPIPGHGCKPPQLPPEQPTPDGVIQVPIRQLRYLQKEIHRLEKQMKQAGEMLPEHYRQDQQRLTSIPGLFSALSVFPLLQVRIPQSSPLAETFESFPKLFRMNWSFLS